MGVGVAAEVIGVGGGNVRECSALLLNTVLQENSYDKWRWLLNPSNGYKVREAYCFLTYNGSPMDKSTVDDVWHKSIPSKVSFFAWRLFRNRLPTRDNLVRRHALLLPESVCVSGCSVFETAGCWNKMCLVMG